MRNNACFPDVWMCLQVTGIRNALEKQVLPKTSFPRVDFGPHKLTTEGRLHPYSPLFTGEDQDDYKFPMNESLIAMTHVCQSWRNTLISTPSLWKRIDFSTCYSKQGMGFLRRSGEQLLDIYLIFEIENDTEPLLSTTLHNLYRLRRLEIVIHSLDFEHVLTQFTRSAPVLEYLHINNELEGSDIELGDTIFDGHFPKLLGLSLYCFRMDFRTFNFPSLRRFTFMTATEISLQDLASFFGRCPSLNFTSI